MKEQNASEETYVLRCTCPPEEHVCFNMSILEPVNSKTSLVLTLKGCHSFVTSIQTGVGETGEYLGSAEDRQVGLGVLGLANLLRRYGVTYEQFGRALDQFHAGETKATAAFELVRQMKSGIDAAASIARANNMVRAFAIAPTASCSYRSRISMASPAPLRLLLLLPRVDRDSGTFGVETYEYGDVEIASEVGWDVYKQVADGIMKLYSSTGLLHGYSYQLVVRHGYHG